eukprot:31311-Pelagococcus_subviridis.AAC.5
MRRLDVALASRHERAEQLFRLRQRVQIPGSIPLPEVHGREHPRALDAALQRSRIARVRKRVQQLLQHSLGARPVYRVYPTELDIQLREIHLQLGLARVRRAEALVVVHRFFEVMPFNERSSYFHRERDVPGVHRRGFLVHPHGHVRFPTPHVRVRERD